MQGPAGQGSRCSPRYSPAAPPALHTPPRAPTCRPRPTAPRVVFRRLALREVGRSLCPPRGQPMGRTPRARRRGLVARGQAGPASPEHPGPRGFSRAHGAAPAPHGLRGVLSLVSPSAPSLAEPEANGSFSPW